MELQQRTRQVLTEVRAAQRISTQGRSQRRSSPAGRDLLQQSEYVRLLARLAPPKSSWRNGEPTQRSRTELLRLAAWRASRSGLDDVLLNPLTGRPEQPAAVTNMLLEHVSDALADAAETDTVTGLLDAVLARGNGAVFQRNIYRRSSYLPQIITSAAAATTR
jgi:gamma-glutamyl:cysteine ligase YbdK (ATP-grasp superfamily)